MAIIDTSTVIHLGKGAKKAEEAVKKAQLEGETLRVSTLTVFELSAGFPSGLEEKMKRLLEPMHILNLTAEHAEKAGKIHRNLKERGEEIGAIDSLIGGTAMAEKEPLITANAKHFKRIDGLTVVTY